MNYRLTAKVPGVWRHRFIDAGAATLWEIEPGRGRKPVYSAKKVIEIVDATLQTKPKGMTHWSCRQMAEASGVSKDTVNRIWQSQNITPHLIGNFKLSRNAKLLKKLTDVVGLYLNPPQKATAFCIDEKSRIQVPDLTQTELPWKKGRCGTGTHDYKCNDTATLFAALELLERKVIGQCYARHRHQEFLKFVRRLDAEFPGNVHLHLLVDNYNMHKHPAVQNWMKNHPRFVLHFVPTSSSWLNLVERWFGELTRKRTHRARFTSAAALEVAIDEFLQTWNEKPKPFIWTTRVKSILMETNRIIELLHNKPTFYGINRTNWTQPAILAAYSRSFNEIIGRRTLTRLLRQAGYRWCKARRVLTSPDPCYHEKVELLLAILHSLASDEMFFFLDEWGPVQVKKRGGRTYRHGNLANEIPRHQTSRGTVSLVSALSATTNRVTWHFVYTKDSAAMFDMIEILFNQHPTFSRIFLTWDAASWHSSISLIEWLDAFNKQTLETGSSPTIQLVPLPTSSQFLDVLEAIFSGMKRAVVHHSDYKSVIELKTAISSHFVERNAFFKENPKRAGKKIWDVDFFKDLSNLRSGDYREW